MNPYRCLLAISFAAPMLAAPAFEMATIKHVAPDKMARKLPLDAGETMDRGRFHGGPGSKYPDRIEYSGVTLRMMLKRAHNLKNYQIYGSAWIDTEQYDVAAKLPSGTNAEQFRLMLQALLTERFRIQLHSSSKLLMAYRLTIAHGGAKLLPAEKLPQPRVDAKQMMEEMRRNLRERAANEPGHSLSSRSFSHASATTGALAETLSYYLNLPVKDNTQIEGLHAYRVEWVPEDPNALPGPNLFMAVEEQLGLKLLGKKQAVQALIIDGAEKEPVEN